MSVPWDQPDADPIADIRQALIKMRDTVAQNTPLYLPERVKAAYIERFGEPPEGMIVWVP